MGPTLPNRFPSIGLGEDVRVRSGSRSEVIVGDMSCDAAKHYRARVQRIVSLRSIALQETTEGARFCSVSSRKGIHGRKRRRRTANWTDQVNKSERMERLEREADVPMPMFSN